MIILVSFSGRLWSMYMTKNNLPFFHSYVLLEYLFLLNIFSQFYQSQWRKSVWLLLGSIFTLAWILNITIFSSIWIYPDVILALEAIVIIILVIGYFRKMLKEKKVRQPARTFPFWVGSGLLLYFSGNFLLFVFSNFVKDLDSEVFQAVWMVHTLLVILLYLMYTTGLLCIHKTNK